jgi:hypothetical protein
MVVSIVLTDLLAQCRPDLQVTVEQNGVGTQVTATRVAGYLGRTASSAAFERPTPCKKGRCWGQVTAMLLSVLCNATHMSTNSCSAAKSKTAGSLGPQPTGGCWMLDGRSLAVQHAVERFQDFCNMSLAWQSVPCCFCCICCDAATTGPGFREGCKVLQLGLVVPVFGTWVELLLYA